MRDHLYARSGSEERTAGVPRLGLVAALVVFAACALLWFARMPGTGDVKTWIVWMGHIRDQGLVAGYVDNWHDYPPLSWAALALTAKLAGLFNLSDFVAVKLMLTLTLLAFGVAVWAVTRSPPLALAGAGALVLATTALAYLDVYSVALLFLALAALARRRLGTAALLFTMSCLTKWQPLIMAPFIVVGILRLAWSRETSRAENARRIAVAFAPALAFLAGTFILFSPGIGNALDAALHHTYLSANALNLGWVATYALRVLRPDTFGGLMDGGVPGQSGYIVDPPEWISLTLLVVFALVYGAIFLLHLRRKADPASIMAAAFLGYAAYCVLSRGVHENHWLTLIPLALVLAHLDRARMHLVAGAAILANFNLLLFYGFDATRHPRVIGGLDLSIPLALAVIGWFFLLATTWVATRDLRSVAGAARVERQVEKEAGTPASALEP